MFTVISSFFLLYRTEFDEIFHEICIARKILNGCLFTQAYLQTLTMAAYEVLKYFYVTGEIEIALLL